MKTVELTKYSFTLLMFTAGEQIAHLHWVNLLESQGRLSLCQISQFSQAKNLKFSLPCLCTVFLSTLQWNKTGKTWGTICRLPSVCSRGIILTFYVLSSRKRPGLTFWVVAYGRFDCIYGPPTRKL